MALLLKLAGKKNNVKADDSEINSIINNLNNMLESKRGYSFFVHNFGLSDYTYLGRSEYVGKALIDEMTENIKLFEPRLVLNEIIELKGEKLFDLAFSLNCSMRNEPLTIKLFLDPALKRYQVKL